uniref:Nuclear pore complex protein Nup214 n=1 Tax=Ascaris suum TaxID=6253 RepID=F1KR81_ASCSU
MATDIFVDITDFQFRALRRVRLFTKPIEPRGEKISPSLIATSSHFGITVVGNPEGLLLSLRTSDVHSLQASHSNRDIEVNDVHLKTSVIPGDETDELIALGCNCSGRILSALVNTSNGPFVHLFDMCAFSPDFAPKAGVVRPIRVSSVDGARGVALEWNPQLDGVFAVIATDGTLSTFLFDIENPERICIVGTTNLTVRGSCISWSPKGKQLVVGDDSGNVLQYKPEMVLVRTIAAPNNITSMQGIPLRCTGLCWLATTEFLVAYSPRNGDEVNIALLTVKKDAPPRWSHLEDVTYSGNRGKFHQKITFTALHQWQIVLCASSRSTEVALLGKVENVWKCWQLDDVSRIETPLGIGGEESFPLGVCIDTSSQIAVKLSDDEGMQVPPCPLVMLISSDGVLLSYSAISLRSEHQNINRASVELPKAINAGEAPTRLPPQAKVVNDSQNSLAIAQFPSAPSTDAIPLPTVSQELFKQLSTSPSLSSQPSLDMASSVQQASFFKAQPVASIQAPSQQVATCAAQTSTSEMKAAANSPSLMKATANGQSTSVVSLPSGKVPPENLMKLRAEFRNKLQLYDEEIFMLREHNDWLKDMHDSMQKNGFTDFSGISNEEGLLGEVEELRVCIDRLIGKLNSEIKELTILVRQEQENVRSAQLQPRHCVAEKLLDFDRWYRQNKLEKALQRVCSKVSVVENWLDSVATPPRQPSSNQRVEASLSVEDERRVVTTARNVCKAITSRRNVLAELQRRFSDLSARYRLIMDKKAKQSSHDDKQPSVRNISEPFSKIEVTTVEEDTKFDVTGLCSKDDMLTKLRLFAKRTVTTPRKINVTPLKPYKAPTKKDTKSIISRIEARLEQSSTLPTRSSQKMMMDIGTQSPDFLRYDVKPVSETPHLASNIGVISASNAVSTDSTTAALGSFNKALNGTPRPQAPDLAKSVITTTSGSLSASRTFSVLSSAIQTPKLVPAPLSSTPLTAFKFTAPPAPSTSPISAATPFASTSASAIAVTTVHAATTQVSTNVHVTSKGAVFAQPAAVTVTSVKASKEAEKTITVSAPLAPPSVQIQPSASTVATISKPAESSAVSMTSGGVVSVPPTVTTTVVTNAASAATPAATTATSNTAVTAVPTTTAPTAVAATTTVQSVTGPITTAITTGVSTTQIAKAPTTIESPATTTAESVSFTFKLPTTVQKQSSPSTTSMSQEASASNSMDEGMMDEEGPSTIPSNLFSSSLSLGLGSANSKSGNTAKNVFGGGLSLGATSPSSSLFGGAANSNTGSVFGGAARSAFQTNVARTSNLFGGLTAATTTQQQQQSTPSFSFSAALAKPQQVTTSTSAFGAKPVVGGTTTFGGAPAFGAKPTFGSPSPLASAFGQARAAQPAVPAGGGFSAFAHGGSSGFGALAASQQAQKSSVFGGSGFAALAQQQPAKSSIFGGAFSTQPNTQSSAFSTWR